mmetsp:Transcript_59435/g.129000  ORF Transcript_59435/g.129000 Transcript_59435/m.129000 type:complete len:209 (+) Transcript_59435:286-912(+)
MTPLSMLSLMARRFCSRSWTFMTFLLCSAPVLWGPVIACLALSSEPAGRPPLHSHLACTAQMASNALRASSMSAFAFVRPCVIFSILASSAARPSLVSVRSASRSSAPVTASVSSFFPPSCIFFSLACSFPSAAWFLNFWSARLVFSCTISLSSFPAAAVSSASLRARSVSRSVRRAAAPPPQPQGPHGALGAGGTQLLHGRGGPSSS